MVDLAFDTFSRLGTLNGVLRYFADHQIQLPVRARTGPAKGELEWRRPTRETLQIMLHNPIYTGYYAYRRRGSTRARSSRAQHRAGRPGRRRMAGTAARPDARLHHHGTV